MTHTLFYWPHHPQAHRLTLAFAAKQEPLTLHPLHWSDDETFFELGVARHGLVLRTADQKLHLDSLAFLERIDQYFPQAPYLFDSVIATDAWEALLEWRERVAAVLERLYAPLAPGFTGIGNDAEALADFKASTQHRLGLSLEELANDRYAGFQQFSRLSRLPELARHLARERFYLGEFSVADCLLAADLYPLQMHDGINLPVDMLYYLGRVEQHCGTSLNIDWLAK